LSYYQGYKANTAQQDDGKAATSVENESYQARAFKFFSRTFDSLKITMLKFDSGKSVNDKR
jgi:hypothetical protein